MAKSSKLYKDSPSLKRGESGEMGIEKPSDSDKEDMGLSGNPLPGGGDGMPVDAHQAEREEMGKKHVQEHKDMNKRQEKEHEAMHARHTAKPDKEEK